MYTVLYMYMFVYTCHLYISTYMYIYIYTCTYLCTCTYVHVPVHSISPQWNESHFPVFVPHEPAPLSPQSPSHDCRCEFTCLYTHIMYIHTCIYRCTLSCFFPCTCHKKFMPAWYTMNTRNKQCHN